MSCARDGTAFKWASSTIKRLSEVFANERQNLEQQWGRNDNVSTEDLRVALRRYRAFSSRLLAI
jgi:hypothetical protein